MLDHYKNNAGLLDLNLGLLQCLSKKDFLQFFIMLFEKFMKRIEEVNEITGKRLLKMTFLIDMEGFTMREMMYKPGMIILLFKIQNVNFFKQHKNNSYFMLYHSLQRLNSF